MKRILLASAMFSMCAYNAMANDCCADNGDERADLTGFLLSLGGVLDIDKYDADIDVAAKYVLSSGVRYVAIDSGYNGAGEAVFDCEGVSTDANKSYGLVLKNDLANAGTQKISNNIEIKDKEDLVKKDAIIYSAGNSAASYYQRYVKAKKNKTVAGGELKGSAFYNVENGLVVGFDLGFAFTGKGKKRVDINTKFSGLETVDGGLFYAADFASIQTSSVKIDTSLVDKNGTKLPDMAATGFVVYKGGSSTLKNKDLNEGAHETSGVEYAAVVTPGTADIDGKIGSLEFEKDPFSPTAAFLVGGYFKGFFGALRLGINYMTGKVKGLQNAEGAAMTYADGSKINLDHKIRQISPVLGVQFMKHIKKGVFVYATYDHMFGARKSYLVNSPVKNFKRRQHRISLGLAYHIAQ